MDATGPIADAELVAPESELSTAPLIIGMFNGLTSLVRNGLVWADNGFGSRRRVPWGPQDATGDLHGSLTFSPHLTNASSEHVIAELDLLLANGRLNQNSRTVLMDAFDREVNNT